MGFGKIACMTLDSIPSHGDERTSSAQVSKDVACIDLFCGAGGLTHGLRLEGIPVVAGIDNDETCRFPFETNNGATFICRDVSKVRPGLLNGLFGTKKIRVLAGCAPCQPFSSYSQRYDTSTSPRWKLLHEFSRLVKDVAPDVITMENVPSLGRHAVFYEFVAQLTKCGYVKPWFDVVDCADHGLPQRRRRLVLLASRHGTIELSMEPKEERQTVRKAIGNFPPIGAGSSFPGDPLHTASRLSKTNLKRIRASTPGGTWRSWPKRLVAGCHQKESGSTYPGVYGRMTWDDPAPTLTTQFYGFGNGRFGHPEQDRAISLREGAVLQGFPAEYQFVAPGEPVRFKALGRLIGNAVPVDLGRLIGRSILAHISKLVDEE